MASTYERYEIKEAIGEGGMGIVYRAIDREMQSDVALKTIREVLDPQQIELFRRECTVLRRLRHPNVVDVFDFGFTEEKGGEKPFFVMPFLPGFTLDKVIRTQRLTPERVVDIILQTARGLQAAHDQGLVHRDVKPSNIFVLTDDSVKLIDFGVVHLTDQHSRTGFKGTLPYMSPEQLQLQPPNAISDVFSLAVVCYEALTRRRPFNGSNENEIREAILHSTPPPASELNPAVSLALSQVVHAAMAKQPWHRTSTARQFAEELQKALHGQPIERFDPSRIEPRIARAQRALDASQYDFAAEILDEIEAEGHIHPTIKSLRRQIDQALKTKRVNDALESAQHRFAENEFQLALQKIDEVLRLDPTNEKALALKREIASKHRNQQIENWFMLAKSHFQNYAYNKAREALQNVLRLDATNTTANQMLADVDRRENEYFRERQEKEELYESALEAWHRGEVSVALSRLERALELDRRAPDSASSESAVRYQNLYNQVRSERDRITNAYEEARKLLSENDFTGASSICEQVLAQYPDQALFQAMRFDIGERQRQYVSSYIVKIDREVEAEPDLDRKVAILADAQSHYPEETHFRERRERFTQRRDLVASITERSRNLEERGQYAEALSQLETLRSIYPQYPGLDLEADRISKRRDQQSKADARARWVNQIDRAVNIGDFSHALNLLKSALIEFPDDPELLAQERLARDGLDRCLAASKLFEAAQALCAQGDLKDGLDQLWQARQLDHRNALVQAFLVETLVKRASAELDDDPKLSDQLVIQAIELDPANGAAANLQRTIRERQRDKAVDLILSKSREAQASGDIGAALDVIQKGLDSHSDEARLLQRRDALLNITPAIRPIEEKEKDLNEIRALQKQMRDAESEADFNSIIERSKVIRGKYAGDPDAESVFRSLEDEWKTIAPKPRPAKKPPDSSLSPPIPAIPQVEVDPPKPSFVDKLAPVVSSLRDHIYSARLALASLPKQRQAIVVAIPTVLILAFLIHELRPSIRRPPPLPIFEATIGITAAVPGAHLSVNGEDRGTDPLTLKLREGQYKFDAALPGYVSKPVELRVERGATVPPTVIVPLDALPPIFQVSTEFQQGSLDNEKLALDGAGFEKTDLASGSHILQLSSPVAGKITVEFETSPGQLPVVSKVDSPQTLVVALATLADRGQVVSSSKTLKIGANGQAAQEAAGGAVPLNLVSGRNELTFDDSKNPLTVAVQSDASPRLTIFVGAQPNVGNLEVTETGKVEASVSIEPADKKSPARTQRLTNGKATFSRLLSKTYNVEVSAPGYESGHASVVVMKGDVAAVALSLKLLPAIAILEIHSATPDADIFLDNNTRAFGKVSSAGDFTSQLPLGRHKVQLRKKDFEDSSFADLDFTAGGTKQLSGAEVALRPFGWIEFNVLPTDSRITYSLIGGTTGPISAKNGDAPHVKAGRYSIAVKAEGLPDYIDNAFEVEAGRGKAFNKTSSTTLPASPGPKKPVVFAKEILDAPTPQTPYWRSQKQDAGTYSFRIKLRRSLVPFPKKRAKWIINFVDNRNYIEYEIDEKTLKYTIHQNGNEQPGPSVTHSVSGSDTDSYDVVTDVAASAITVSIRGQRISIPTPGGNLLAGRFAFPNGESWDNFQFSAGK